MSTEAMKAARKALSDRSFRLALLGYVPEDDPEIVADMQNRIDQLEAQLDSALSSDMVMVPREPTEEMVNAAERAWAAPGCAVVVGRIWPAMIAAAIRQRQGGDG